ncbi:hypothetical protein BT67DRAFT_241443 [Trichocladium antarcticum]|uniref:Uncharacterized protein n=1 Tax=Trichocladium antarcticum TaxID=1450529 RepID=A0AAN6Z8V6_9PEZI|nr:hypothetical protein BT67DRAFT_241443 [Trichocladium antarcticum]
MYAAHSIFYTIFGGGTLASVGIATSSHPGTRVNHHKWIRLSESRLTRSSRGYERPTLFLGGRHKGGFGMLGAEAEGVFSELLSGGLSCTYRHQLWQQVFFCSSCQGARPKFWRCFGIS